MWDDQAAVGRSGAPDDRLIKLSEAARRLGFHVETLRLRIRQGQLAAVRGPHGQYYVSPAAMAAIEAPKRSARRAIDVDSLEWTWYALEQVADRQGASYAQLRVIGEVRRNPALSKSLHRLFTVKRLRIAHLSSAEIAYATGLSPRQVRRLSARRIKQSLEQVLRSRHRLDDGTYDLDQEVSEDALEDLLQARLQRRQASAVRPLVEEIQRRLKQRGFRYQHRIPQFGDTFVPRGEPARAIKVYNLPRDVARHLLDGGLSAEQIDAIRLVGIGQDELNELILRGLPPGPA